MKYLRRGNKDLMKELNRSLVLHSIRTHEQISRTDISHLTHLGMSTVSSIVDELLRDGFIYETGEGSSSGGRKPILLKFNGNSGYIVGVKVEPLCLRLCLSNLDAKIFERRDCELDESCTEADLLQILSTQIADLLNATNAHPLQGIGITAPGLVDKRSLRIAYSPILKWKNIDFAPIQTQFQVPVFLENDANAFALAEKWIGAGDQINSFIGVTIGKGIGAGIILNNELFVGENGGAGELGHTVIQREGELCYCGQRGCLEMYASDQFVLKEAKRILSFGSSSALQTFENLTVNDISTAAAAGDYASQQILINQGTNIGIGLRNLVNLLNPKAIILGGEGFREDPYLLSGIKQELSMNFFHRMDKLLILTSQLKNDAWLIGACSLVVNDLFKPPIYRT